MKIKVGIIARSLTRGGVKRYIFAVLDKLEKYTNAYDFYVFYNQEDFFEGKFDYINKVYIPEKNKLVWDYIKFPLKAKELNLDTIIYTKNIIPFTNVLLNSQKINIIHDLGFFEERVKAYKTLDTIYMKAFMKLSCQLANQTIAVSKFTKLDIVKRLNANPKKIKVIYEGVELKFRVIENGKLLKEIKNKYSLEEPFLFYCGSLSPRKNLKRILKAFNKVKNDIPHNLYLTGNEEWEDPELIKLINRDLKNRVEILGYVSEEELIALYSMADLYLYPSLYEGFGLPILEAQACGCPVLTSNVTSCPEVAGDGAHIIDPYSTKEIKNGILKMANNLEYKKELIEKGYNNVQKFNWDKTAKKLLSVI